MKSASTGRWITALLIDLVLVYVFAFFGYRAHYTDQATNFADISVIATPFILAFLVSAVITAYWRTWWAWIPGIFVWLITVFGGIGLRVIMFNQSAATGFIVVTTLVLGAFLWIRRLISWLLNRKRLNGSNAVPVEA